MKDKWRAVATRAIEELDKQLRVLEEEKSAATSATAKAELNLRIELLTHERRLWESVIEPENLA